MPLVIICIDSKKISDEKLGEVRDKIPKIVANVLAVPGSKGSTLTKKEIEERIQKLGKSEKDLLDKGAIILVSECQE